MLLLTSVMPRFMRHPLDTMFVVLPCRVFCVLSAEQPPGMSPVWTPLKPPPEPDDIHLMSDDAWTILHVLREAHRKREEARQQRLVPLGTLV